MMWILACRTWTKMLRRPVTLTFSFLQPVIWMLFFGFLMQRYPLSELPHDVSYLSFIVPGICAMTVLLGASQMGISLIRDMQTGFLQRMLLTPASRWTLHSGKVAADSLRLLAQALVILLLGASLGATFHFTGLSLVFGLIPLFFFAIAFGSLSCVIALWAKKQETMATFVHVINMPLFFTSTALVPHKNMPTWLATLAQFNPLSLAVESLREGLLFQETASFQTHFLLSLIIAAFLFTVAVVQLNKGATVSAWETK